MFTGEYQYRLDAKGRCAIPAKLRSTLGQNIVLTRGIDRCLYVYRKEAFAKLAEKLASLPLSRADSRALSRLIFAGAAEVQPDRLGRIVIPPYLRHSAALGRDVVILGVLDRLEIWDRRRWEHLRARAEAESERIAERLSELGL